MLGTVARSVVEFLRAEDGPTAVEYAVMLALIIVVCVAAVVIVGKETNDRFDDASLKGVLGGS
jgi:pilus assembly protein Flp/PilA